MKWLKWCWSDQSYPSVQDNRNWVINFDVLLLLCSSGSANHRLTCYYMVNINPTDWILQKRDAPTCKVVLLFINIASLIQFLHKAVGTLSVSYLSIPEGLSTVMNFRHETQTFLPTRSSFIGSISNNPVSSTESAVSIASKFHTFKELKTKKETGFLLGQIMFSNTINREIQNPSKPGEDRLYR